MSLTSELILRSPTTADAQIVLDLMIRCDIAEYGEDDSDMEDLTYDWGEIDLEKDAWLAFDSAGDLAGYAAVLPWGEDLRFDFYSDPDWPETDLGCELLDRCLARGRAIAAGRGGQVNARTFVAHSNQRDLALVRQASFEPGRYILQMWLEFDGQPPAAVFPPGVSVRCAIPVQDDRQLHALIQDAFHQPGRTPQPFEDWREFMMRADIFDPELWFLALEGERLIGACLAFAYPASGWVRQLGVTGSWRGRGLGKALLQEAFSAFYARGFSSVGLTVESERPDAHTFYKAVGMRQGRQYDEFKKPIN